MLCSICRTAGKQMMVWQFNTTKMFYNLRACHSYSNLHSCKTKMHTLISLPRIEAELKESENMLKEFLLFINIKNSDHQLQIESINDVSSSLIKFLSLIFLFCSKKKKKKDHCCTKNSFSTFFSKVTLLRSSMNVYK